MRENRLCRVTATEISTPSLKQSGQQRKSAPHHQNMQSGNRDGATRSPPARARMGSRSHVSGSAWRERLMNEAALLAARENNKRAKWKEADISRPRGGGGVEVAIIIQRARFWRNVVVAGARRSAHLPTFSGRVGAVHCTLPAVLLAT